MKRYPTLLYTYLLTEMLAPFFAALLVINAVLFLGRLIPLLDRIFQLGIGLTDFIRVLAYLTPSLLLFSLPMAAMMAVIIAFSRLAGDMEIMALKASGISLLKMLPPVIVFGLATSLLTLLTATQLIPQGMKAMDQLMIHLATERLEQGVREKTFSDGLGEVVLYVEETGATGTTGLTGTTDPTGPTGSSADAPWRGVYLSDLRDRDNPLTINARSGGLRAEPAAGRLTLDLADGSIHRTGDDKSQTIFFRQYRLELPITPPVLSPGGRSSMTQDELLQRARRLGPDHPGAARFITEYHQRLALPAGCFLLCLLGLSLSQMGQSSRLALGVPLGLLSFIGYYILFTAAKTWAEGGQLPAAAALWLPNLVFLALAAYLLWRSILELGNPWLDRLIMLAQDTARRFRQWRAPVAKLSGEAGR